MTITQTVEAVPTGLWKADPVHSSVGFSVRHMGVSTFKGGFDEFTASLDQGVLAGSAKVASVRVQDPNLTAHLLSPERMCAFLCKNSSLAAFRINRQALNARNAASHKMEGQCS